MVILLPWIVASALFDVIIVRFLKGRQLGGMPLTLVPFLLGFGAGAIGFFSCMRFTRVWRREGKLRGTTDRLSLVWDGQLWSIDLRRPFELFEWSWRARTIRFCRPSSYDRTIARGGSPPSWLRKVRNRLGQKGAEMRGRLQSRTCRRQIGRGRATGPACTDGLAEWALGKPLMLAGPQPRFYFF